MYTGRTTEYRVPEVLQHIRKLRRESSQVDLWPSSLWGLCEAEVNTYGGGEMILRALYTHAFAEAGFILDKPDDEGGKPYEVCPVCGYVFS
jgi:hypothetical protein